ncbi:signal peptidase II [Haematobacter missouriensis]|uniref:Lipoprotein signal peptidase n=2 Tax=Haematobacter missouriensis TaxID=366616 RepID=A0A212AM83_9RHOB|nr:signal peptidase II [Haematobacter missouriensis]OWJ73090.1 signal peptidase II [Haematobacter missouriensis]OWJ82592.1 signal peptidase II [Haematobacter missouriensis]
MARGSLGIMAGVATATFVLDQLSKFVVVHLMSLDRVREIDIWPPYLNFRMAWNRGVNFGLLQGDGDLGRWLLIAVALVISAWVWLWMRKEPQTTAAQVSAGLLIGGAIGNVIDRVLYGAVADFLNMSCCGIDNPWAFNVADIAVFAGAIGLVLFTGRDKKA